MVGRQSNEQQVVGCERGRGSYLPLRVLYRASLMWWLDEGLTKCSSREARADHVQRCKLGGPLSPASIACDLASLSSLHLWTTVSVSSFIHACVCAQAQVRPRRDARLFHFRRKPQQAAHGRTAHWNCWYRHRDGRAGRTLDALSSAAAKDLHAFVLLAAKRQLPARHSSHAA